MNTDNMISTVDLACFERFTANHSEAKRITITAKGNVSFSSALRKETPERVALHLNKNGAIIAVTEAADGYKPSNSIRAKPFVRAVRERRVSLPAHYYAEWDGAINGFVARLDAKK